MYKNKINLQNKTYQTGEYGNVKGCMNKMRVEVSAQEL